MKKLIISSLLVMAAATCLTRAGVWPECPQSGDLCVTVNGQTCCIDCGGSGQYWYVTCCDGAVFAGCQDGNDHSHLCDSDGGNCY